MHYHLPIKLISFIISFITLISLSSFYSNAKDEQDETLDQIIEQSSEDLFSGIDNSIIQELEKFGITSLSAGDVYNVSIQSIIQYFSTDLATKVQVAIKTFFKLFSVLILMAIVINLFKDSDNETYVTTLAVIILIILMVDQVGVCLNTVISVLKFSGNFMLAFVPVFTFLISMSGNPSSAITYNSLVFLLAQAISGFANYFVSNFMGLYFCICISFSINPAVKISSFIGAINKYISFALGLISTVFTAFLSIKNVLAVSIDSVSVKGVRFLISSLVPVVGRAISDAYSSIVGSINLIKSSAAVIGILVITILNVPVIIETLLYYIGLSTLVYISDALELGSVSSVLKCFSSGIKILLLILVFEMFVLIISTGIMISFRSGV